MDQHGVDHALSQTRRKKSFLVNRESYPNYHATVEICRGVVSDTGRLCRLPGAGKMRQIVGNRHRAEQEPLERDERRVGGVDGRRSPGNRVTDLSSVSRLDQHLVAFYIV